MSASAKSTNQNILDSEIVKATVMDAIRLARHTLRNQAKKPFAAAETFLPGRLAAPVRQAGRFSFMMGDAVEQAFEQTVHSLRGKLLPEGNAPLTPSKAQLFNRLLSSRASERQALSRHYTRYFYHNARHVLESFGIRNYLLMEGAILESYAPVCTWLSGANTQPISGKDDSEQIFACASACLIELVHKAPLKVLDDAKFDIPVLGDRGLQAYANQLVFGYVCYLTALCNLRPASTTQNLTFLNEMARNDVVGEFTSLITAICLPDPHQAVTDFFVRRFRMSPIAAGNTSRQSPLPDRVTRLSDYRR